MVIIFFNNLSIGYTFYLFLDDQKLKFTTLVEIFSVFTFSIGDADTFVCVCSCHTHNYFFYW